MSLKSAWATFTCSRPCYAAAGSCSSRSCSSLNLGLSRLEGSMRSSLRSRLAVNAVGFLESMPRQSRYSTCRLPSRKDLRTAVLPQSRGCRACREASASARDPADPY